MRRSKSTPGLPLPLECWGGLIILQRQGLEYLWLASNSLKSACLPRAGIKSGRDETGAATLGCQSGLIYESGASALRNSGLHACREAAD